MRIPKISKPKLNKISLYLKGKSKISYGASKILLYYSTFLSTILIIGGFYTARSGKEVVSNFLFLPIVVFLWLTLIKYRKEANPYTKNFDERERKQKILTNNSKNSPRIDIKLSNKTKIIKQSRKK